MKDILGISFEVGFTSVVSFLYNHLYESDISEAYSAPCQICKT